MTTRTARHRAQPDASETKPIRCAVYTRKSTEEGLDQRFNSLDAQREAAEAYIASQKHEGWTCVPDRYDDGGYSGATMDRPALKRLIAEVEADRIDCIVFYRLDRLSRCLADFARITEILERHQCALVSVTEQFNTSTPSGRLHLNMVMTFAQHEREVISQRTADKMSAARRKGKYTGGPPILGYDTDAAGGRLVVNEAEATTVRSIFDLYLERQSLLDTARELNLRGIRTKAWTTRRGTERNGHLWDKTRVGSLLQNIAYTGRVRYHGEVYPGEHPAIVDTAVWERAQKLLRRNGREGGSAVRTKHGTLLRGLLRCAPCGCAMTHSYTQKGERRYRYYVCVKAQKHGWQSCPTKSIPAAEIERFVVERIRGIGRDPSLVDEVVRAAAVGAQKAHRARHRRKSEPKAVPIDAAVVTAALAHFDDVWDALAPREQARVVHLLVERVSYDAGRETISVTFRPGGIKTLAQEGAAG